MVLPLSVYAVKAAGLAQGLVFCWLAARRGEWAAAARAAGGDGAAPPRALLAFRLAALALGVGVGANQLAARGAAALKYSTVWNWWLLTAYFALAAASSARRLRARGGARRRPPPRAGRLELAAALALNVAAPMSAVIASMTWGVLVPALLATPDSATRAFWVGQFFSAESYLQHGGNVALAAVEVAAGRVPALFFAGAGAVALWASAYGAWSTLHYARTRVFVYPFLDAHRPYAWAVYVGLFAVHWLAFAAFAGLVHAREAALARAARRAAPRRASAARAPAGAALKAR